MTTYEYFTCWKCKEPSAAQSGRIEHARRSNTPLHCPFGHANYWTLGKSELEKLREELDQERRNRQRAEQRCAQKDDEIEYQRRSAIAYKGQATKLRNRAKAGVCPCCKRTVSQLAAHMATKHPEFQAEPPQPDVSGERR